MDIKCEKCGGTGHKVTVREGWLEPKVKVLHCDACKGHGYLKDCQREDWLYTASPDGVGKLSDEGDDLS